MLLKDMLALALILAGLTATIALATLFKAIIEYKRNASTKRLELFLAMRTRLRQDKEFIEICELLEMDDERLRSIPLVQKDRFTGFFEELAIMRNSGLINDAVTLYMFGYWAIRCNQSDNFWYGLNRNQALWSLFFSFATDMERAHATFAFNANNYKPSLNEDCILVLRCFAEMRLPCLDWRLRSVDASPGESWEFCLPWISTGKRPCVRKLWHRPTSSRRTTRPSNRNVIPPYR
jgi:hypothetical protein